MVEILMVAIQLTLVTDIRENSGATTVQFGDGRTGTLAHNGKQYDAFVTIARRGLMRRQPVAVSLDKGGNIVQIRRADNDVPVDLKEEKDLGFKVWFAGHDGVFFLRNDHPNFEALRRALSDSVRSKSRVWFVAQLPELVLLDLKADSAFRN